MVKNWQRKQKKWESVVIMLLVAMLISSPLASASSINCTVTIPVENPDLTLSTSDIHFDPEYPLVGKAVTITAFIHNIGGATATNVAINITVDDTPIATYIISIPAVATTTVSAFWTATDVGFHDVTVKIDEQNAIDELNEANNRAQKSLKVTKPLAISLTASAEIIEANESSTSTITAVVTDESGKRVSGIEVTFSTTLGTVDPPHAITDIDGIATTTLTASTSAGTTIVTGSATVNETQVEDAVTVVFEKTAVAKTNKTIGNTTTTIEGTDISIPETNVTIEDGVITINTTVENATIIAGNATSGSVISILIEGGTLEITLEEDTTLVNNTVIGKISEIKLNTPPEEYITSKPEVGTASVDLDVVFQGTFTPENLALETTLRENYEDLPVPEPSKLKDTLAAYFGVDTSAIADNTPVLVYAELSATNLTAADVTGVPIRITVNKEWYNTVAGGDPGNVTMFKLNETTGAVESVITMTAASITINDGTVTFFATFDHFSVFALVAQPAAPSGPPAGPGPAYFPGGPRPTPGEITIPIANPGINIINFDWLGLDIKSISLDLKQTVFSLKIKLEEVEKPPEISTPSGMVYAYFEIVTNVQPDDLKKGEVKFEVKKEWVRENRIDADKIRLERYVSGGGWEALPTTKSGEDDKNIHFTADTVAFSLFAIIGEEKVELTPPAATPTPSPPPTTPAPTLVPQVPMPTPPAPFPVVPMIVVIVIVVAVIIVSVVYLTLRRRRA